MSANETVNRRKRAIDFAGATLLAITVIATATSELGSAATSEPTAASLVAWVLLLLAMVKGLIVIDQFMGLRWVRWRWRGLLWLWVVTATAVSGSVLLY
ncbi:MAG: cytochrome C oxidase subunit IV family protein [Hydrogenophilus thermoluteolus]